MGTAGRLLLTLAVGVAAGAATVLVLERRLRARDDQAWFWTPEWQAGERQADADIAEGRVETFESDEQFLKTMFKEAGLDYEPQHFASAY